MKESQNKTKVGLKVEKVTTPITRTICQNKTKVGLKDAVRILE